jgi:hypothetical protein
VRPNFDQDALTASLDLVRRTGARSIEIGYLRDDVPVEQAGWYAQCMYSGARLIADEHRGPVEAVEALARRVLDGALCRRCGEKIRLSNDGKGCRWRRRADKWEPGCGKPIDFSIPRRR